MEKEPENENLAERFEELKGKVGDALEGIDFSSLTETDQEELVRTLEGVLADIEEYGRK